MNRGVRIIKRDGGSQNSQIGQDEKTERQSEREIASTVKNSRSALWLMGSSRSKLCFESSCD